MNKIVENFWNLDHRLENKFLEGEDICSLPSHFDDRVPASEYILPILYIKNNKEKELAEKLVLDNFIENYEYIDIQAAAISKEKLIEIAGTNIKSMPVIFLNDKFIGGYQEFKNRFPF